MHRLHPELQGLLEDAGWTKLTPAQEASLDGLLQGGHHLLVAPTGYGKTEAAVIPILHRLLQERDRMQATGQPWPPGFKVLYITPLRALNRDLMGRLEAWGKALGLPVGVRHGDTTPYERSKQSKNPPEILITTPETVQLLLYGDRLRSHLSTVRFVVLDEVHDLAASERGSQLMIALERIEEVVAQPAALREAKAKDRLCPKAPSAKPEGMFQRIGLSATVADPEAVARFMAGDRPHDIIRVVADKQRHLDVVLPEITDEDHKWAARLALPSIMMAQLRLIRQIVADHERVLIFHNNRDGAELLASRSAMLDDELGQEPLLDLHHGSLSPEHRADVESRFKDGDLRGVVATSSLELGIDVGAIDHVVQVHSPRSVARMVQRLGRAGHRVGAESRGTLIASGPEDAAECQAVAEMVEASVLEPLRIREAPLVVLANQLVALSNEYSDLARDWVWSVVTRAGPFVELEEGLFEEVWQTLLDVQTVFEGSPGHMSRSGRGRRHFLDHISLIQDERKYRIFDEAGKRTIGSVDDAFVAAGLHPGAAFVMAGRTWNVLEIDAEAQRVRVAPAKELGAIPQWSGEALPVSYELAHAVARQRKDAMNNRDAPWATPVLEQIEAGLVVPTDAHVTLETGRNAMVCCVALGTRGNDALGRITAALLHQKTGTAVPVQSDAYRIHFQTKIPAADIEELWRTLDPDTLDLLLGMVLKDAPVVRHHLVHVAKHFGALPKMLDPNRTTKGKLDALWDRLALQEETLSRLLHDRFDVDAVQTFLRELGMGRIDVSHQALGPIARQGLLEMQRLLAPPKSDERLLAEVRKRIEESDVLLVCTNCTTTTPTIVADVPRRMHCRRCQSQEVACLRPWQEDKIPLLRGKGEHLDTEQRKERKRLETNGRLMQHYAHAAARLLAGRGIGAGTATRILQKVQDIESPAFWRELLAAELEFARTSAFWK